MGIKFAFVFLLFCGSSIFAQTIEVVTNRISKFGMSLISSQKGCVVVDSSGKLASINRCVASDTEIKFGLSIVKYFSLYKLPQKTDIKESPRDLAFYSPSKNFQPYNAEQKILDGVSYSELKCQVQAFLINNPRSENSLYGLFVAHYNASTNFLYAVYFNFNSGRVGLTFHYPDYTLGALSFGCTDTPLWSEHEQQQHDKTIKEYNSYHDKLKKPTLEKFNYLSLNIELEE